MTGPVRGRTGEDRGSVTLELTILAPGLLALLGLAIGAGRYEVAAGAVEAASAAAARSASLARSAVAAQQAAHATATATLTGVDLPCTGLSVTVETDGFGAASLARPGRAAQVTTTVTCHVDWADLLLVPGLPGSRTVTSRAASVLDTYRSTA